MLFITLKMKDTSNRRTDSFLSGGLNSLINDCSTLQASVNYFKSVALTVVQENKINFDNLKRVSQQGSLRRWISSQAYREGKAKIASKAKPKEGSFNDKEICFVKSLVIIHGGLKDELNSAQEQHSYACPKDLTTKQVSQLLALNRRKFGESFPTSLLPVQKARSKSQISFDGVINSQAKLNFIGRQKQSRSLSQTIMKSPPKTRQLMVEEQENLYDKMEKMNSLNRLIFKNINKYKPALRSKLHYQKEKDYDRIASNIDPLPKSPSVQRVRQYKSNEGLPRI